nr:MAG TPA: hypothetical protein [Caudoviricetes sp.]
MLAVFCLLKMYFSLTNHYQFDQNTKTTLNP